MALVGKAVSSRSSSLTWLFGSICWLLGICWSWNLRSHFMPTLTYQFTYAFYLFGTAYLCRPICLVLDGSYPSIYDVHNYCVYILGSLVQIHMHTYHLRTVWACQTVPCPKNIKNHPGFVRRYPLKALGGCGFSCPRCHQVWLTAIDSQHFSVTDKFDLIIGHFANLCGVAT